MLTKNEFVDYIAKNYNTTKKNANEIVSIFTEAFMTATKTFDGVKLVGFMTSAVVDVAQRDSVNPSTGEKIVVPAHKTVRVKVGKMFKTIED